ncbi:hypothetical protein KC727_00910 [Candidatus Kaiserbacteria bacterium]|nr:hypothetical protein [Candidatus Kaiserbacteria bacterium]
MLRRFLFVLFSFVPNLAFAHEVYVLPEDVREAALQAPSFSFLEVIQANLTDFLLWGFVAFLVVFLVFFASISRFLEHKLDPFLAKLPPYAPVASRIAIGASFLASAYYGALFGPELPLDDTFGAFSPLVTGLLVVVGIMTMLGVYARIATLGALMLFIAEITTHGWYMLTYLNYAGELVLIGLLGAHHLAFHHKGHDAARAPHWFLRLKTVLAPYAFLILRIAFGVSLIFASLYAKVFHNELALAVTTEYPDLLTFFGFEAHFLVLGAAIIEILIGLFFILGVEIRFTALFMLFWLSLSLWYFGEAVWPHLILIGIPIAFIFYGYDRYSLEGYFFKKNGREPVL